MVELFRVALAATAGWLTAQSAYTLLSPIFVQRRPVLAACMVGSIVGLVIPAAMTMLTIVSSLSVR